MIAVLYASPLCYLLLIGEIDLLPQLFSRVLVPQLTFRHASHVHENRSFAYLEW